MPDLRTKQLVFGIAGNGESCSIAVGARFKCMVCGKRFTALEAMIEFMGEDCCPSCILAGPQGMAARMRKEADRARAKGAWYADEFIRIAAKLDKAKSFAGVEGGTLAVKIAEAYREIQARPTRGRKAVA